MSGPPVAEADWIYCTALLLEAVDIASDLCECDLVDEDEPCDRCDFICYVRGVAAALVDRVKPDPPPLRVVRDGDAA